MAHLEVTISFLLVATFALLFVTVLTSTVSQEVYFASIHGTEDITRITVGMWGACSNVIGFTSDGQRPNPCTPSTGAYDLTIYLPTIPSSGIPQTQIPYQLNLLSRSDTGPLLCLLLSFLFILVAMVPWFLDVCSGTRLKRARISRISSWVLVFLSMVLAWVGFGFATRLKSQINCGLEGCRATGEAARMYQASHGNAVWCALAGAITATLTLIVLTLRWSNLKKNVADDESTKALRKESSTA